MLVLDQFGWERDPIEIVALSDEPRLARLEFGELGANDGQLQDGLAADSGLKPGKGKAGKVLNLSSLSPELAGA
ncbi:MULTISPECIES: hypothetical protein [Hyphomicrobiales]|jgi:hypothetical protein|uniref:hypothetical protein n=1 Tax=Hyphomicrobiales TaxID=356 RepID=UPI0003756FFC|nr:MULTISPECIES: hypothetical protein [Phyllobacteriaceae]MCX8567978.1 hypothetical protein [Aminobacter sp. MET-1]